LGPLSPAAQRRRRAWPPAGVTTRMPARATCLLCYLRGHAGKGCFAEVTREPGQLRRTVARRECHQVAAVESMPALLVAQREVQIDRRHVRSSLVGPLGSRRPSPVSNGSGQPDLLALRASSPARSSLQAVSAPRPCEPAENPPSPLRRVGSCPVSSARTQREPPAQLAVERVGFR